MHMEREGNRKCHPTLTLSPSLVGPAQLLEAAPPFPVHTGLRAVLVFTAPWKTQLDTSVAPAEGMVLGDQRLPQRRQVQLILKVLLESAPEGPLAPQLGCGPALAQLRRNATLYLSLRQKSAWEITREKRGVLLLDLACEREGRGPLGL